ncbi:MAG: hypothetical protein ACYDBT_11210 [Desulfobulbaceae bacterium]
MKKLLVAAAVLLTPASGLAHHGGVTLAFGPGSPMETNSPMTLPEGGIVTGLRAEQVEWQDVNEPEDKSSFSFFNVNLSYGFTPALTGTVIVPYYIKRTEGLGENEGLADAKLQLIYGFHYDPGKGFSRNGAEDTAVSMESQQDRIWLGVSAMMSLPTGDDSEALADGSIDPGMQTGFGAPSYTFSLTAARPFGAMTLNSELSADFFTSRDIGPDSFQFGTELRGNLAGVYELYGNPANPYFDKVDGIMEFNFLHLERDEENGAGLAATGGNMLYFSPGVRLSLPWLRNANLGLLVKIPIWKNLNEEEEQQGAEGLEEFRLISTLSFYF